LSYFLDFMSSIDSQAYLFFLLNAEGMRKVTQVWRMISEAYFFRMENSCGTTNCQHESRGVSSRKRQQENQSHLRR